MIIVWGGTALPKVHFRHRQSFDLDFFCLEFNREEILVLIKFLSGALRKEFQLIREQSKKEMVRIMCVQKTGPIDVYEVVAQPIEPRLKEK